MTAGKLSRRWIAVLVLEFVFCATSLGSADLFTLVDVTGNWSHVVGDGSNVHFCDDQPIAYGNGQEDQVRWGTPVVPGKQSGLGFAGAVPPPSSFAAGDPFEIGQLRHFNYRVYQPTATQADLSIELVFSSPGDVSQAFTCTFCIDETLNIGGYVPDWIGFPSSLPSEAFMIDGTMYTLELLGFGDGPSNLIPYFLSQEMTVSSAVLWGRITSDAPQAPVPSALLLSILGAGLAGRWSRRRKR
jgi:hypothetical protein